MEQKFVGAETEIQEVDVLQFLAVDVVMISDADLWSRKRWKHAQVMVNHFWRR